MMRKSRIAGSYEFDNNAKCLPPGMPAMMGMAYGMEVMQTKDKITFFSELNDALRRVYLDGRKPTPKILDDPTYAGYSTGHWEGDTLVVDTVLHPARSSKGSTPQRSDDRRTHPSSALDARGSHRGHRSDRAHQAWETVRTYRKRRRATISSGVRVREGLSARSDRLGSARPSAPETLVCKASRHSSGYAGLVESGGGNSRIFRLTATAFPLTSA
jgi:hypothetical protein